MANTRGKVEVMTEFLFLDSKVTADGDCSHEIRRCLLLGRKVMTNLDSVLKSRDITLLVKERKKESYDKPRQCVEKQRHYSADKGPYIQGYGLPTGHIWLLEQDIKKAEHQRIDAFNLWFWRRLLRVSWTAWRLN